jgi:hypothetical protein
LFYSGVASANRGDTDLAASRWEILLGLNPPPEIRSIIERRVAEWRGAPVESPQTPVAQDMPSAADTGIRTRW